MTMASVIIFSLLNIQRITLFGFAGVEAKVGQSCTIDSSQRGDSVFEYLLFKQSMSLRNIVCVLKPRTVNTCNASSLSSPTILVNGRIATFSTNNTPPTTGSSNVNGRQKALATDGSTNRATPAKGSGITIPKAAYQEVAAARQKQQKGVSTSRTRWMEQERPRGIAPREFDQFGNLYHPAPSLIMLFVPLIY
jgi:hypothetical protein